MKKYTAGEQTARYLEALTLFGKFNDAVYDAAAVEYSDEQMDTILAEFRDAAEKVEAALSHLLYTSIDLNLTDTNNIQKDEVVI